MRTALVILWLSACGGASAPPPATHDDFRAIQGHESTIAAARARVANGRTECPAACGAAAESRGAAEAICRIAEATADLDATARCDRARGEQREIEATAADRCGSCSGHV